MFYGCRNHNVYPFDLKSYQTMAPLHPPHFDAVTSLAVLDSRALVSGSKDKNLRAYNLKSDLGQFEALSSVVPAHADKINAMATDNCGD